MEKYSVIYVDPPWAYNRQHCFEDSVIAQPMKFLSIEEIKAIPVPEMSEEDCVLFLWTTTPILPDALSVVAAWGFTYKTLLTWEKTNEGCMGYWFKTCTEHLIVAMKGKVKAFGSAARNCYHEPKSKHGKKPEYFYRLIERVAKGKRIELFPRRQRHGWDVWDTRQSNTVNASPEPKVNENVQTASQEPPIDS